MSLRDVLIDGAVDRLVEAGVSPADAITRAEAAYQRESPWLRRALELPPPQRPCYAVIDAEN